MTVVGVASLRGAPGATTTALALASAWDAPMRYVIEADPVGGVLAARLGLSHDPGLVSLVADRRADVGDALDAHAQATANGVRVVCGPANSESARTALTARHGVLEHAIEGVDVPVIIDLGRLDAHSAALPLARLAATVLVVARPRLDEIEHLVTAVPALVKIGVPARVVLIGDRPYDAADVASVLGDPNVVLEVFPHDPGTAAALNGDRTTSTFAARRSALLRSAVQLSEHLAGMGTDSERELSA